MDTDYHLMLMPYDMLTNIFFDVSVSPHDWANCLKINKFLLNILSENSEISEKWWEHWAKIFYDGKKIQKLVPSFT
jgi:hypothetical protein